MKVSKEQAEQNRDALLDAASRLYREHGLEGVGVAQIAREAGLTHGSLYGHFESKDHFAAEACEHAFINGIKKLRNVAPGDDKALAAYFKAYLSERHRDTPHDGCPIAALGAEAARKDGPIGETMMHGVETYVKLFVERYSTSGGNGSASACRDQAITTLAMMVGGMVLSRATSPSNPRLSKQILAAVLDAVTKEGK
jgi:TetR/AcrR family transcriptional regulator, transcriptional repressor for nem operon